MSVKAVMTFTDNDTRRVDANRTDTFVCVYV